jgi:hypothetical protein
MRRRGLDSRLLAPAGGDRASGLQPDATFLFDIDPATGRTRRAA